MNDQYFQNTVKMSQALQHWLDKNNFDKVHICIDDTKNEFLQQSLNSFLDDFFYKETRIFNPAWFNIFDYKEDETFYAVKKWVENTNNSYFFEPLTSVEQHI